MSKILVGKARLALASMLLLAGLVATACSASPASVDAVDLVPADAEVIGVIDLGQILNDPDIQQVYEQAVAGEPDAPPTLDDALNKAIDEIGIDISTFEEILVFGRIDNSGSGSSYGGFMASGSAAQEGLLDLLIAAQPDAFTKGEYGGRTLLFTDNDDGVIAVLGGVVVAAEKNVVEDVIDVYNGDADKLSGDLLDGLSDLGDPWVKFVMDVPDDAADEFGDMSQAGFGFDLGPLLNVQQLSIVLDKDGGDATIAVVGKYPSEKEAEDTAASLEALLTVVVGFSGDETLKALSESLFIGSEGDEVTIEFSQDIDELLELVRSSGGASSIVPF